MGNTFLGLVNFGLSGICAFRKYSSQGYFQDIGVMKGKYYALNFPLRDGISDENYKSVFEPVSENMFA